MALTAILNANVYQQPSGDFAKKTILVEDEKIAAILPPTADLPDCNKIDAANLYLTPGLIDTCSQIGLKEMGIRWEGNDGYEPNEENNLQLQVVDGIYPFDKAFHQAVASGVTTAHIVSAPESVVGARTAVIHTYGTTVEEMVLKNQLGFSFSMGDIPKNAFWEKTHTPLTRMGIAQKIRAALKDLQNANQLQGAPLLIRAHRADDIATAFRIAEEFQVPFILVHATEYSFVKNHSHDISFSVIAGPCFQSMERGELQQLDSSLYHVLFEQQAPFTFATDHPVSSVTHLQLEAALARKASVPEKVILNGLTSDAAKLLQIDHLTGKIEKGLLADLVLWNKHPLEITARAVRTFIKGKEVFKWE